MNKTHKIWIENRNTECREMKEKLQDLETVQDEIA